MGDSLLPPRKQPLFKDRRPSITLGHLPYPEHPEAELTRRPFTLALQHGDRALVGTAVFFAPEADTLDATSQENLRAFVNQIRGKPQKLEIRGHATRRPATKEGTRDPWQLSYLRCVNTMQFLAELGIPARQIRLSQAGDSEPYTIGDNPERVARNSRVEVFLLNEVAEEAVGTAEEREQRFATP
jgi:chemotaxis protein MotB